ncbi:MAG: hypothetical protein LBN30_04030 [Oscillospiraceae bacterium]|jgi:hypothetical protein|nr:hypothetical protein [Oscillospiraceae bacterium]
MAKVNTQNASELKAAVEKYLAEFPGDLICARQLWYEGLGGEGAANATTVAAIEAAIAAVPGWNNVGDVRYEKFGSQNSYKLAK